ncbi:MAG: hypothetical protein J7577_12280 [Sphingobacteriaceae bacterium]|nr:hypothetical protein [Sphingobacteriaceae bacterium]
MSTPYQVVYLFENTELIILNIKLPEAMPQLNSWHAFHWLYFDKTTKSLVTLWFHSSDASAAIEERYFEQDHLKFSRTEAVFIEKFNSSRHKLINYSARPINADVNQLIVNYLKCP